MVLADAQTKGKGKPGASWFSPAHTGIYLSAVVKPYINPKDLAPITLLGARAVVSVISKVSGIKAAIKPPNDVLINGKKVCGILVERVASGYLIIGIGVNLNNPAGSFPEKIKDAATSLYIETRQSFAREEFTKLLILALDKEYLAYLGKI